MEFTRQQVLELPNFQLQPSFFFIVEFNNWWMNYFQGHFSEQNFNKRLSITFSNLQDNPDKKTGIYLFTQIIFINT